MQQIYICRVVKLRQQARFGRFSLVWTGSEWDLALFCRMAWHAWGYLRFACCRVSTKGNKASKKGTLCLRL